mmetsp:Transcript_3163/g.7656  ORF Transcript_3163/g.7656 Transcript_3163/m.7656 type:complete len:150 (+) Transcript_3163:32-481(+)|eukprot:CAMPEP_0182928032 /NCGR_PEP_ID=MMETSP0105_2-20130417/14976_1 /TAXON_ID=81532 ORGANISM="Acanthoeca-like sp., Strain 10tr" /NCGR_SAMPLE_ID=MMETSP0105_2 /ASSEMBLY_ACC=CAM_ASM_000205 /LENGTH=149 /DNA_ID=CAMNT_0025066019 /DNA_START=33 /DNA_END=482 /DNA_ORIENTATION=+
MKVEMCMFSGYKIHPGHGKLYTRVDGKSYTYLSRKAASLYLQRKNPRKIAWTVLYRRKHKKSIEHETSKRKVRRVVKKVRAVGNISQEELMKRRNEKPDFQKVKHDQAVKAAKEKAKAARAKARAANKAAGRAKQPQIKSTKAQGRGKR